MSAAPAYKEKVYDRPAVDRVAAPRVKIAPRVDPRVRVIERQKRKANPWVTPIQQAIVFSVLTFAIASASSLAGNVMMERARRDGISAAKRTREAIASEAVLQRNVDRLSSVEAITDWTRTHGFKTQDEMVKQVNVKVDPDGETQ